MSSGTVEESWWAGVIRPTMRKLILTWSICAVALWVYGQYTWQQTAALQDDVASTRSEIAAVNTRIQQGDTSIIAEMELMRKRVADFDSHFRLLSDRIDEAKSNQAVERAKVADVRRESSVALSTSGVEKSGRRLDGKDLRTYDRRLGSSHRRQSCSCQIG